MVGPPALIGPPVTVNVPVVPPEGIVTLVVDSETNPFLSSESSMVTPVAGAGEFSVMVPVTVFPTPTLLEPSVSVMTPGTTSISPKSGLKPGDEAVMIVDPTLSGVIVTAALNAPVGTVTDGGAVATVGSSAESVTTWPLPPAAVPSVTVKVPGLPTRVSGFGESVMVLPAGIVAVIVTV